MSLFQSLEIDTLKVRNILTRTVDNSVIPLNFTLFSKGDGTTYWSTGVTAAQYIALSTTTAQLGSTVVGNKQEIQQEVASTLNGISTFTQNLSTYAAGQAYTNQAISTFSTTNAASTAAVYTTLVSTGALSTSMNRAIISSALAYQAYDRVLSTQIGSSIIYTSTTTGALNTFTTQQSTQVWSTLKSLIVADSTILVSSITYTNNNILYVNNTINDLAIAVAQGFATTNTYPGLISNTASTLSTAIAVGDANTLAAAKAFTSSSLSTALITVSTTFSEYASTTSRATASTTSGIFTSIDSTNTYVLTELASVSTTTSASISTINENISTIIATGLVDTLYQSFIELEQYSYNIIISTLAISNDILLSTTVSYAYIYDSTLTYINISTFNFLVANAYESSISTVVPLVLSTMDGIISTEVVYFNSTIEADLAYFNSTISATVIYFNSSLSSLLIDAGESLSTFVSQSLSEQIVLLSTAIELISTFENVVNISTLIETSTLFGNQYNTAPSIILNSIDHLSTLTNVGGITDLMPITVGIAELDVSQFNNFYILISDIRSDVYYGVTYKTTTSTINRDINVTVDIQSSYRNSYLNLDTANITHWLSTPPILNPAVNPSEEIPISAFMGLYQMNLRLAKNGMFLRDVYSYPYVYSLVSFTGPTILQPPNVQVTDPTLALSTFRYRGSQITVSWNTNDPNIPLGINFLGVDTYGNTVSQWSGPFNSAARTATFGLPAQQNAPYVSYRTMALSVYPDASNKTTAGNSRPTPFAQQTLSSLVVVNPSLNSRVKVFNDGTNPTRLQVAEIYVYNEAKQNMISDPNNAAYRSLVSTSSVPFNSDPLLGAGSALDNNPATAFWAGINSITVDRNAFVQATLSSAIPLYTSTTLVSSIVVLADTVNTQSLYNMNLTFSNWNDRGVPNGLFYSTIVMPSTSVCVYNFGGS